MKKSWHFKPRNCLTYAISMWIKHGGYIKMRKSLIAELHGCGKYHILNLVPHFLHQTREGKVTQLVRTKEENIKAKKFGPFLDWLWLWHFNGEIVEEDVQFTGRTNDRTNY
jgi:hypothetical protein